MSNNNTPYIPQLRFPGFTGEWKEKIVEDIFRITRGLVLAMKDVSSNKNTDNPYPVYSSQTLNNGLAGFYRDYLYENAITWTTDGANAGEVRFRRRKFYCTNVCGVLLSEEGYANECVAAIINSVAKNHVSYVGNPKLMNNVMAKIPILLPPSLAEQQKIADCLSSLDDMISAEGQKTEALREYKRGLMQQLFPANGASSPQLRFPGFTGEWKEKKIGEVANFQNGYSFDSNTFSNEGDYVIRISDIQNGLVSLNNATHSITNVPEEFKVISGDILIAMSGATTGKIGEYKNKEIAYINQRVGNIKPFDLNKKLLLFMLQSASFTSYLNNILTVGAQPNISALQICSFPILLPPTPAEQQKIADCLSSLDEMITAQAGRTEALREYKRGLMQQLFPQPSK